MKNSLGNGIYQRNGMFVVEEFRFKMVCILVDL